MTRTEIINQLIKIYGYESYCEVGVDNPAINFNKIICKDKVGVDPNPRARATFGITSDQFFNRTKKTFSCYFIDGLHTAEQVERDIQNALDRLDDGGSIICHDMNPTTELIQRVPRESGEWCGNVWQGWLKFRQRKDLSMHVLDTDYGVGVIRKGVNKDSDKMFHEVQENPSFDKWMLYKKEWSNIIPVELEPVSICIPVFEQYGEGSRTLKELLLTIRQLKGKFEVIVSDNSEGDKLKKVCEMPAFKHIDLTYFKNPKKGVSANTNAAIAKAKYNLIKPMYMDDLFLHPDAINQIAFALKFDHWVACYGQSINASGRPERYRRPKYSEGIIGGQNTIGMPSVIAYRKNGIKFDTKLKTLLDCSFYYEMFQKYGEPGYLKQNLIGSRYWDKSTSRQQGNLTKEELPIINKKHGLNLMA